MIYMTLEDAAGNLMIRETYKLASEARIAGAKLSKETQQLCYVCEYEDYKLVYREHLPGLIKMAKFGMVGPDDPLAEIKKPKRRMAMDGVTAQGAYVQSDWLNMGRGGL